jgi:choline dehydrogenase-like flavoprotein
MGAKVMPRSSQPARSRIALVSSPPTPAPTDALLKEERQLRWFLWFLCVTFVGEIGAYVHAAWTGPAASRGFAVNSAAKDCLFLVIALVAAGNLPRFARLAWLLVIAHVAIVVQLAVLVATGRTDTTFPDIPFVDESWRLPIWLGLAAAVTVLLWWLLRRARRARCCLLYLSPAEHGTLAALADAALDEPLVAPDEIARRVDHYWKGLRASGKSRLKFALWIVCLSPLARLHLPLPLMRRDARREFVERRLYANLRSKRVVRPIRMALRAAVRFAVQMVYLGYYSDERSYGPTGFVPLSKRRVPAPKPSPSPELTMTSPWEVGREAVDVVIVGTGAAGGMLAACLVERGMDVVMLERGEHLRSCEFTEDEAAMYEKLYSDGAMQMSRDFAFQVLQGMCVGGSTVVNNGVCFDLPAAELARWNGPNHRAGLPAGELAASFEAVRKIMHVTRQTGVRSNPGGAILDAGAKALGLDVPPDRLGVVEANLACCIGCGYCNIGCAFGRKLSMLDWLLPQAQQRARENGARLLIVPECEVTEIMHDGSHARGVRGCVAGKKTLTVNAKRVVVAAGALHSSRLLQSSVAGGELVGQNLCANIATHLTAEFKTQLDAYAGLQMSHYFEGAAKYGPYAIEDWFNPVMSQSLVMPGWLAEHQRNMHAYNRMTCLGVLVGTSSRGNRVLKRRDFLTGSDFQFRPNAGELARLVEGLQAAGRILFRRGATRVMPATFAFHEFTCEKDLERLPEIAADYGELSLNTAHPQGGNAISESRALGAVDPRFRVHGFDNLYVCDASVFPTAITVNPQLTVMALAHYAATRCID